MIVNRPVVVEDRDQSGSEWLLSFGGSNPSKEECIALTRKQCNWLMDKINTLIDSLDKNPELKKQPKAETRYGGPF